MLLYPLERFAVMTYGGRPNQMDMGPYEGAPFDCACGRKHSFNSQTVLVLRELTHMRLVFACPDECYVTCVKLHGILTFKGFESLFGGDSG